MRIYSANESKVLEKMRKKRGEIIVENSQYLISQANGLLTKGMFLVELPLAEKVFLCDGYTIRGDLVIATSLEDKEDVTLINSKTGEIELAKRVEYSDDLMIATFDESDYYSKRTSRKFIDASGKVLEGEIGLGGFVQQTEQDSTFVDENGNTYRRNEYFIDFFGRVRAGYNTSNCGIYHAFNVATKQEVGYNILGNTFNLNDVCEREKWIELYEFSKGEKKLDKINAYHLLDNDFYNAVVDIVNKRYKELAKKKYGTTDESFLVCGERKKNDIITSLEDTLKKISGMREEKLETRIAFEIMDNSITSNREV